MLRQCALRSKLMRQDQEGHGLSTHRILSQFTEEIQTHLPELSVPMAKVMAEWSFGMAQSMTTGLSTVALTLSLVLGERAETVKERLSDWYKDAASKSGTKRQTLDPGRCFASLLRWIVRLWPTQQIALALDATSLSTRFTILTISVVYGQTGLPVAWKIMPAGTPGSWRQHWLTLLDQLSGAIPEGYLVLVLADRGLWASWLFRAIQDVGWHPFLRVNSEGSYKPDHPMRGVRCLRDLVRADRPNSASTGRVFSNKSKLYCTVLACYSPDHAAPWVVLTDLQPGQADIAWYALRSWCEQGFKCIKSSGWQWHRSQMRDPRRAERVWLALAVAMLWTVSLGARAELQADPVCAAVFRGWTSPSRRYRQLRLVRLGLMMLATLTRARMPLPMPALLPPCPWPSLASPLAASP